MGAGKALQNTVTMETPNSYFNCCLLGRRKKSKTQRDGALEAEKQEDLQEWECKRKQAQTQRPTAFLAQFLLAKNVKAGG